MKKRLRLAVLTPFLFALSMLGGAGHARHQSRKEAAQRGRLAEHPIEMTWLGWRDIALRTWNEAMEDRLFAVAAGVAFFALLALAPGLSVLISLYGLIADPVTIAGQLGWMMALMPSAVAEIVIGQATRIAARPTSALSFTLLFNITLAAISANAAIKAMFDALNVIYDEEEKRGYLRFNLLALSMTIGATILLTLLLLLAAVTPWITRHLPFGPEIESAILILRWPVFFVIAILGIAILYWIGPSRHPARFIWVIPGAVLASTLWAIVSSAFSWYVATLSDYAATYGSLAAVIVFMTWLWLSVSVILFGAELNAELEHQTARDTTIGPEKPMGLRGATMADQVGPPVARKP